MKRQKSLRCSGLFGILCVFLLMAAVLFAERKGICYYTQNPGKRLLRREESISSEEAAKKTETVCLVLADSQRKDSRKALKQFHRILTDMKTGYQAVDVAKEKIPPYGNYETVVVLLGNLNPLRERLADLTDWVAEGGSALFAMTLEKDTCVGSIEQKIGVAASGYGRAIVESIFPAKTFMAGGGQAYEIPEPYDSAWAVQLSDRAFVHVWTGDEKKVPLVWEHPYGKGKFVVDNFGLYEKVTRGLFAASYSLLTDVGVYPVINGSAFYLDDFPSPIPAGNSFYVNRDYGMTIGDFYINIWWPDMLRLGKKHGVKYTGGMILNYENNTDSGAAADEETAGFRYFGKMLLRQGGELGYHGCNHQPLCLGNTDYGNLLPYRTWESRAAMEKSIRKLMNFGEREFPGVSKSVYVPPSNVLSEEGREMLAADFPEIRTIAGTFFEGEMAYAQEFGVARDGMVEQPRITSGTVPGAYGELAAFSELNMHFVNNHFIHPDDLLDEDRGAALGWEKMRDGLDRYMDWLDESAPMLRKFTGSELSAAVQRYSAVTVEKEIREEEICIRMGNFYDEAWLLVRFNEGMPGNVRGGTLKRIAGNLYLLKAEQREIIIERNGR